MSPQVLDIKPLDRRSPVPLYHQLREQIVAGVENGDVPVGATLPPEEDLVDLLGVSRHTVRRAMQELEYDGYILRVAGRGTTVLRTKVSRRLTRLTSFSEDMQQRGQRVSSRILAFETVPAPGHVAEKLCVSSGTLVTYIYRLRSADGIPIALTISYIPFPANAAVTQSDLERFGSLYALFERHNIPILEADRTLEAMAANEEHARLLDLPVGAPLLLVEGVAYSQNHVPIEYHQVISAGARYKYAIHTIR